MILINDISIARIIWFFFYVFFKIRDFVNIPKIELSLISF